MLSREEIILSGLLDEIKNSLDVTWADEATDKKYCGLISSGMQYLDGKAGGEMDYRDEGGIGLTLLREYVRYARDGAMDVFETNYLHLLLSMQNDRKVKAYAAAQNAVSSGE